MRSLLFLSLFALPQILYGDAQPYYQAPIPEPSPYVGLPWLTGTLLTYSENVVPLGKWNLEPYLLINTQYGKYDKNWHNKSLPHYNYQALSLNYF